MAKFCKYCGTPLAEGQVCTCPQAQADASGAQSQFTQPPQQQYGQQQYNQQPQAPKGPSPVGSAFHNLGPYLKTYFRSPVEATRSAMAQRDLVLPIVLLVIQMIVAGLTIFSVLNKFVGIMSAPMRYYGSTAKVTAPFLGSLLAGILAAALAMIVYILLMFAVAKIMGSSCSFQDVLIASGANSLFVTAAFLLSFLVFFVSMQFGFILLLFTLVVWMGMSVPTVQAVVPNSNSGKFWICYVVSMLISLIITYFILSKCLWMAVRGITYTEGVGRDKESYTIGDMADMSGIKGFGDIWEEMLDDIF